MIAEYDKLKRIVFPARKNYILYITITASLDYNKAVRKVSSQIITIFLSSTEITSLTLKNRTY